ncbi:hypothetical protein [Salipiger aestuarii]|uniref:hypothetical protein n=1 Tax=Salipiger aestuarii TaxID=568098 RepID=UPI00025B83AF|nr:hypothetical protein [Salipiger aestuarii]EIE51411.1 hypothetical protein C357_08875 [Citreicella sp. 357]KAA8612831.1 hypothetical protein AL037_06825 [Salipiger aestuarii]
MIQQLAMQSLGAGVGVFLGVLIGLGIRKRKGNTEGLLGGSVILTASAAAGLAMVVMMAMKHFTA